MLDFLDFHMTSWLDAFRAQYRARGFDVTYWPFVYGAEFLPLVANTTQQTTVTIDQDADFILCLQTFASFSDAGAVQAAPNVLINLRLDTSQRFLMSQPVHLINIFGTGERPHQLFKPLLMPAKTTMNVEADSDSVANSNLRLSFIGVKAYLSRAN